MDRSRHLLGLTVSAILVAVVVGSVSHLAVPSFPSVPMYLAGAALGAFLYWLASLLRPLLQAAEQSGPPLPSAYKRLMSVAFGCFCVGLGGFALTAHGLQAPGVALVILGVTGGSIAFVCMVAFIAVHILRGRI